MRDGPAFQLEEISKAIEKVISFKYMRTLQDVQSLCTEMLSVLKVVETNQSLKKWTGNVNVR